MIFTNSLLTYFPSQFPLINKEIENRGGKELLKHYKHPYELLSALYPEQEWLPWKFETPPTHYWKSTDNQRKFVEWVGKQLNIKEMKDWYHVSIKV